MQKSLFLIVLIFLNYVLHAQTLEEWTKQKKTQKKYLLQQVAALKIYLDHARNGYEIVNKGLTTIGQIKTGEFNLHNDFFRSLEVANPHIKNSAKVADIISYQLNIIRLIKRTLEHTRESKEYNDKELEYCKAVFDQLLNDCLQTMDDLVSVLTSFQMTDDERIKRVEQLHISMQEKYSFAASFSDDVILLSLQRIHDRVEIDYERKINSIK
ncbi:MAG: hypothetical protein ABI675_14415 [Chitinophagaceae bacterium]